MTTASQTSVTLPKGSTNVPKPAIHNRSPMTGDIHHLINGRLDNSTSTVLGLSKARLRPHPVSSTPQTAAKAQALPAPPSTPPAPSFHRRRPPGNPIESHHVSIVGAETSTPCKSRAGNFSSPHSSSPPSSAGRPIRTPMTSQLTPSASASSLSSTKSSCSFASFASSSSSVSFASSGASFSNEMNSRGAHASTLSYMDMAEDSGSNGTIRRSCCSVPSFWALIAGHCPPSELEEVKSIIGARRVRQVVELREEADALVHILDEQGDIEEEVSKLLRPASSSSSIAESKFQRPTAEKRIEMLLSEISKLKHGDVRSMMEPHERDLYDLIRQAFGSRNLSSNAVTPERKYFSSKIHQLFELVKPKINVFSIEEVLDTVRECLDDEKVALTKEIETIQNKIEMQHVQDHTLETLPHRDQVTVQDLKAWAAFLERIWREGMIACKSSDSSAATSTPKLPASSVPSSLKSKRSQYKKNATPIASPFGHLKLSKTSAQALQSDQRKAFDPIADDYDDAISIIESLSIGASDLGANEKFKTPTIHDLKIAQPAKPASGAAQRFRK